MNTANGNLHLQLHVKRQAKYGDALHGDTDYISQKSFVYSLDHQQRRNRLEKDNIRHIAFPAARGSVDDLSFKP